MNVTLPGRRTAFGLLHGPSGWKCIMTQVALHFFETVFRKAPTLWILLRDNTTSHLLSWKLPEFSQCFLKESNKDSKLTRQPARSPTRYENNSNKANHTP